MEQEKLRYGIMINAGLSLQEWQRSTVDRLMESGIAECSLLIVDGNPVVKRSFFRKLGDFVKQRFLYQFYTRFFCKALSRRNRDCTDILGTVPAMRCQTQKKGRFSEYFSSDDIQEIKKQNLDFILRFAFNIIRGDILGSAKYGVWSFHHGDEKQYRGGPTGFWEIFRNEKINGAILQRLTDSIDAGVVLKKGYFSVITHSYPSHIDQLLFSCASWPLAVCLDIRNHSARYFDNEPSLTEAPINKVPGNSRMVFFLTKLLVNRLRFHFRDLFFEEQWNVGVIHVPLAEYLEHPADCGNIQWMTIRSGRFFYADPFITGKEGKVFILFEKYDYRTQKGVIQVCRYDKEQGYSEPITLLDLTHHLSYPHVFKDQGEIYFIPEQCAAGRVDLYRLDTFLMKAVYVRTLLKDVRAVDSTVFHHHDHYWLFCTLQDHDSNTHLYAWYAESLDSEFKPHHNNPVKSDISSSRPAGAIFRYGDFLCRPAQDCSALYGGSVKIFSIQQLNPFSFHEEELINIQPYQHSPYPRGLHTVNHYGPFVVIDSKRLCFIWDSFIHKIFKKFSKSAGRKA